MWPGNCTVNSWGACLNEWSFDTYSKVTGIKKKFYAFLRLLIERHQTSADVQSIKNNDVVFRQLPQRIQPYFCVSTVHAVHGKSKADSHFSMEKQIWQDFIMEVE